ncbi:MULTISPECIES: DUF2345 domain-containing protein [Pantoea]|uniref:Type VI secretion system tip protein VgrG n=1 Tax=Pantoea brenneri TaxID=472694 RepID=A0ABU9MEB5_9GAMM|nr:type VI secretion system tip protein VgrG [Pantoea sp. 3.5.1]
MSPAQQRGLAMWAALLSTVVCLGFVPVSRLVSVLILVALLGLILAFWTVKSRRAEHDDTLPLDDLPEATYRQPVVLVCGDLPQVWPHQSLVLTVTQGCWIRVEDPQNLEQAARQVLRLRPDWGPQLSVMVSVCPQKHADSERLSRCLLTRDYNYRQATEDMNARVDATRGDVTTCGDAYHYADNYLTPGNHHDRNPAPESGAFYARIRHERYLNGQTQTRAITGCPTLSPGQVLKVTGGYEVAEVFAQGVVVTAMHSHARRDEDFSVSFDGIPDSTDFSFRPEPGTRPVMAGTLPARVTSTTENDTYGHIDKDGRYRVHMMFDREDRETGFESLWVRQSRPYAGDTYGLHLPLLAGTEVAIGFEDGNPDRPYIAGVLHDSAHGDPVTIRNYKRNVLRTPANNKIRLDDERGKEHIKVSTEYGGKSQLNLGHLVDSEKQKRGEGFELRTDSWGAIRAQKGLFISADGQTKAQGQVLEMAPAISNLGDAREQMTSISDDAQKATANPADLQAQIKLLEQQLTDLKKSVLLLSAPEGMALTSGQHLQVSAGQNLIATAGKNADVSVVKNLFIGVGNALSVFVRKLGIRLIANQGPVKIQAQNNLMELVARGELSITSTEDEIHITANKRVVINGGGSYINLDANGIESATLGEYRTKAGFYGRKEKANNPEQFPSIALETTEPSRKFSFS